jgi:hypothetical protein
MTEWYTHFDPSEFGEVPKVQAKLLKPKTKKEPSAQTEKSTLTLVEMPENKKAS